MAERKVVPSIKQKGDTAVKNANRIYVGADLPSLVRYTSVTDKFASDCENEVIRRLIIPISELADFEKQVKIKGSYENIMFEKSKETARRLRKDGR